MKLRGFFLLMLAGFGLGAQDRLTFEVASVHKANPDARGGGIRPLPGGQTYKAENVPARLMFSLMYKVSMQRVTGGPAWFENERWDVDAKAAKPSTIDDLHTMYQNLLADDFHVKFHKETKEGSVWALVVDKGGSKMKLDTGGEPFDIPIKPSGAAIFDGKRVPMSYLCYFLTGLPGTERPVIDKTGLSEFYAFQLKFLPELPPGVNRDALPQELLDRPSLFDALRQQLGLKLEAQKGPVEYYVIDHAERPSN